MKSIKVRLTGGIGNQLFQIVAGLAVGKKRNQRTIFLTNNLQKTLVKHENDLQNHLAIDFTSGNTFTRGIFFVRAVRILDRFIKKLPYLGKLLFIHDSREIGFAPEILTKKYRIFHGLYQSYIYLDLVRKELSGLITNNSPSLWFQSKVEEIGRQTTVAIHIRRGDYKNVAYLNGILGANYYRNALNHISDLTDGAFVKCYVFSDSIEEAKGLIGDLNFDFEWIVPPSESCSFESLLLISKCNYQIIANSTFSWWGAALSTDSKLVICPASWMRKGPQPSEMYPPEWVKIESDWLT